VGNTAVTDGLTGENSGLNLPTDHERTRGDVSRTARESLSLDAALLQIAPGDPSAAVFAAFQVLLYRLTGQQDFTISVGAAGSALPEAIPARSPDRTGQVACRVAAHAGFRALVTASAESLRCVAADTLVAAGGSGELADARPPLYFDAGDLRLLVASVAGALTLSCEYDGELFEPASVCRWLAGLQRVLEEGIANPDARVCDIDVIGAAERAALQCFGAPNRADDAAAVCVHTLVERHAARAPTDEALVFGDEVIEYGTLDRKATAVGKALIARGVGRGAAVAIYLSRSADLVISLLGIMKAGAVSVLLDPADPPARAVAILEHSGAVLVLTDLARRRQLPPSQLPIVCVEDAVPAPGDATVPPVPPSTDAIACLLYACEACVLRSIPVSHGTLAALFASIRRELSLTHEDVALAISTPSLDVSLIELLAPLSASGCVIIADDDVALDSDRLTEAAGRSAATVMIAPTTVWADLLAVAGVTWPRLKAVCFGGMPGQTVCSELGARTAAAWSAHGSADGLWTTLHRLTEKGASGAVGRPLGHVDLRIVDAQDHEVPIGVVGELLVGTGPAGVGERPAREWMRTGERARWRADGEVELVTGRPRHAYVDGFRIDLEDVACAIRRHPSVGDAEAVVETDVSPNRLVACVVPRAGVAYSVSELRRELRRTVPAAMVPRAFVEVGSIPRAPDGRAVFPVAGQAGTAATQIDALGGGTGRPAASSKLSGGDSVLQRFRRLVPRSA
jgi:non-ribosomal peptide synthetase component F